MGLSKSCLRTFCKNFSIPIQIFDDPYLTHLLNLYDQHFQISERLEILRQESSAFPTTENFFGHLIEIEKEIIKSISESDGYIKFRDFDMGHLTFPIQVQKIMYITQPTRVKLLSS